MRGNQTLISQCEIYLVIKKNTFPGVVVLMDPSASLPAHSLSLFFPVFSCFFMLKRWTVAPPITASVFPRETSQTCSYRDMIK